jgi:DNA polymerase III sliding clamp (beta) subunit (PCNA family)
MIYSRANFQAAAVTSKDKDVNVLSFLYFDKSGFTAGIDGKSMMVVEPPSTEYQKHFVIRDIHSGSFSIPARSVNEILKAIPRDVQYKGLLEQAAITKESDDHVEFSTTDGLQTRAITTKKHRKNFPNIKEILKPVYHKDKVKVCINRARLIKLLTALDKACPDSGGEQPVYLEISSDSGEVLLRTQNVRTGQVAIGLIGSYEGEWLKKSKWEKEMMNGGD